MSLSQDQVIDYLSNLTVLQISDLVKSLEDKWGVKAAAAVAVAAGPAAAAAAAPAEEKTEFDVILKDGGAKKIDVIKALRAVVPGLALKEAKDMVEGAPTTLKTAVSKADAETLAKALREAGATVDIK